METIKKLVEQYFEGNTSLEEEQQLRNYFRQEEVADDLMPYQGLFDYLHKEHEAQLPDGLAEDWLNQLESGNLNTGGRHPVRRLWPWMMRIAAVLVLAFGIWWMIPQTVAPQETAAIDWSKYEPETPEEALEIYKNAILRVGKELKRGTASAVKNVGRVEEVGQFFE